MLAGVSQKLNEQLRRTGMFSVIGEENIFLVTEVLGESGNVAMSAARSWLAESAPAAQEQETIDQ